MIKTYLIFCIYIINVCVYIYMYFLLTHFLFLSDTRSLT